MEFLNDFIKRMRSVGRYAVLMNNSFQKTTWKQYGIDSVDEQINLIFTVLLFLMEESLKEENCTIDDIAEFIGEVNDRYFKRSYSYEDLNQLADFIVNVILSNSGSAMYFQGYDYEKRQYVELPVQYIANRIVYLENGVRRTSYYLTEDGYNMVLSTMELENNLKLTVHEMLFKLHLEKADYSRAVNDIKNVFDQLRMQTQKIQEAMRRIRQNALSYSVEEYREIVEENIHTIEETREKFRLHKEAVEKRVQEYEQQEIDLEALDSEEEHSLESLKIIDGYLNKSLDEHQKILNEHFDLKSLYDMELENYSNMTMVQRFHFRSEFYDYILMDSSLLGNTHEFFKPLFWRKPPKIYNPNKAFELQQRLHREDREEETQELGFEEEEYREEQARRAKERLQKYSGSLSLLISRMVRENGVSLAGLKEGLSEQEKKQLIPAIEIFREIMIELLTAHVMDIEVLEKEQKEYLLEESKSFQLNEMLLQVLEEKKLTSIRKIYAVRSEQNETVVFENVENEQGEKKKIRCSNVELWFE